jgi:hypothetical protein
MTMAVEAKRGCGYRKVGGLYLVSSAGGISCCRLPIPLTVCPCCGEGIKQARGWVWVNPTKLLPPAPCLNASGTTQLVERGMTRQLVACPGSDPAHFGERAGMLWVGKAFYPTAGHFTHEANTMGVSRRIKALPQGFKLGEQWVLLAHPEACADGETKIAGVFLIFKPQRLEKIVTQSMYDALPESHYGLQRAADEKRGITWVPVPDNDADHQGSVHD